MKELIIGGDGFIGRHLREAIPDAPWTSRCGDVSRTPLFLDLAKPYFTLPTDIYTVYLCAGVNGALNCARDPQGSWAVNVDGRIRVADWCQHIGAFLVYLSSTTVEWQRDHYGEQQRVTEMYMRQLPHIGIIRAGRVDGRNVADLCLKLIDVGRSRIRCLELWNHDEQPYHR